MITPAGLWNRAQEYANYLSQLLSIRILHSPFLFVQFFFRIPMRKENLEISWGAFYWGKAAFL